MSKLSFRAVTYLPADLEPDTFYFVQNGEYAESFLTSAAGEKRYVGNGEMIREIAATMTGTFESIIFAEDITERDALAANTDTHLLVLVLDAQDDPAVTSGSVLYAYSKDADKWYVLVEYEDVALEVTWAHLQGRPQSSPAAIDASVQKSHTHANTEVLAGLGVSPEGVLTYNGELVYDAEADVVNLPKWSKAEW